MKTREVKLTDTNNNDHNVIIGVDEIYGYNKGTIWNDGYQQTFKSNLEVETVEVYILSDVPDDFNDFKEEYESDIKNQLPYESEVEFQFI
jgi:hypothetical protein